MRTIRQGKMEIFLFTILCFGMQSSYSKEYILLGNQGDTILYDEATSKTREIAKLDLYKDEIGEAVMGEDSDGSITLYVLGELCHTSYFLHPLGTSHSYDKLPCKDGEFFVGLLYDTKNKGPAVVAQSGMELSDLMTLLPEGQRARTDIEDCLFVRSNIVRQKIADGIQNDQEMGKRFPEKASEFSKRQNRGWVITGQSETTTLYNRTVPMPKDGERDRNSLFFIDRGKGKRKIFDFEEFGRPYTFDEIAVIMGEIMIPKNGVFYGYPSKSGNVSFYFPGADDLVKCSVDPKMMIVFADSTSAFFTKGNDLYKMPISRTSCGTPVKFLSLDFEVFQMFPVPGKRP